MPITATGLKSKSIGAIDKRRKRMKRRCKLNKLRVLQNEADCLSTDVDELTSDLNRVRFKPKDKRKERLLRKQQRKALKLSSKGNTPTSSVVESDANVSMMFSENTTEKPLITEQPKATTPKDFRMRRKMRKRLAALSRSMKKFQIEQPCDQCHIIKAEAEMNKLLARRNKRSLAKKKKRNGFIGKGFIGCDEPYCFRCRKPGHVSSHCTNEPRWNGKDDVSMEAEEMASNAEDHHVLGGIGGEQTNKICYRCGAGDHSVHNCTVKTKTYGYAVCFRCNQAGHILSQCPLTTSIYPNGGCCHQCGSTMHLAKDCTYHKTQVADELPHDISQSANVAPRCLIGRIGFDQGGDDDVDISDELVVDKPVCGLRGPKTIRF